MAQNENGEETQKSEHVCPFASTRRARQVRPTRMGRKGASVKWAAKNTRTPPDSDTRLTPPFIEKRRRETADGRRGEGAMLC